MSRAKSRKKENNVCDVQVTASVVDFRGRLNAVQIQSAAAHIDPACTVVGEKGQNRGLCFCGHWKVPHKALFLGVPTIKTHRLVLMQQPQPQHDYGY